MSSNSFRDAVCCVLAIKPVAHNRNRLDYRNISFLLYKSFKTQDKIPSVARKSSVRLKINGLGSVRRGNYCCNLCQVTNDNAE